MQHTELTSASRRMAVARRHVDFVEEAAARTAAALRMMMVGHHHRRFIAGGGGGCPMVHPMMVLRLHVLAVHRLQRERHEGSDQHDIRRQQHGGGGVGDL